MTILQCPWTFRPSTSGQPGSGRDWRWWHPDWTGTGNTWYADKVIDMIGLDTYDPLPGGTTNQDFLLMLNDTLDKVEASGNPRYPYVMPEFGMSNVATPTPNWVNWCTDARDYAKTRNIRCFCYWNNNNDTPRRYDFTAASDPTGAKLNGWHVITAAATTYIP